MSVAVCIQRDKRLTGTSSGFTFLKEGRKEDCARCKKMDEQNQVVLEFSRKVVKEGVFMHEGA